MAEVADVAEQVRQHWLAQGLQVSSVGPEDLAILKQSLPAGIPKEYEAFLILAGLPSDEDRAGFRFWLPREQRTASEVLHDAGYESDTSVPSVIIADYLQESWWYGLWLAGPFAGYVSLVVGNDRGRDPQPPLGTLVDFLLAYLKDDARLYPPASATGPET